MTLSDVKSRLIYDVTVSASDVEEIDSIIDLLYVSSDSGRQMLDTLVSDDRYLKFIFQDGVIGSSPFDQIPRPQIGEVYFDFYAVSSQSFINQDGNLSTFDSIRAITHEIIHQTYFTYDMTYLDEYGIRVPFGEDTYPSFDFQKMDVVGDTVQMENLIMSELGSNDIRVSYPGAMLTSWFDVYGQELTRGNHIDTAIISFQVDGASVTNVFTNDLFISGDSTDDLVIGASGSQYIFTGAGNDHLRDGSGADILEGGAGDDSFYLYGDSDPDIVIVGQGNDRVVGGDEHDTLVFRANLVAPVTGASGLVANVNTTGIPLLGGFLTPGWPPSDDTRAIFVASAQNSVQIQVFDLLTETLVDRTVASDSGLDAWSAFSTFEHTDDVDGAENPYTVYYNNPSFKFVYTLDANTNDLKIDISYIVDNSLGAGSEIWQNASVVVEDFEEGDFGIQFYERGPSGIVSNSAGVDYIHNGGNYMAIPEAPATSAPEQEQQRSMAYMPPNELGNENTKVLSADAYSALNSLTKLSNNLIDVAHPGEAETAWRGYFEISSFFDEVGDPDESSASILQELASQSLSGIWYEPEPIGGLL